MSYRWMYALSDRLDIMSNFSRSDFPSNGSGNC